MYEKLARGHATAYINDLQDYGRLARWLDGPRLKQASDAFEKSSFSKKPGRVLKRLASHLRPCFQPPVIDYWFRHSKAVTARGLARTAENHVFHLPDDTRPLYSERAVFLTELWLSQDHDRIMAGVITGAAISHHAIARLVEREAVQPEDLPMEIDLVLGYGMGVAERILFYTAIDPTAMQSFMLPFRDGALVAVLMDMDPAWVHKGQKRRRILSVRTWLDQGMLSDFDRERMGGIDGLIKVMMLDREAGRAKFGRWLEGNVRPWSFSDSTLGDRARG